MTEPREEQHAGYIAPTEFAALLDSEKGERGMLAFFAERPQILYWTLCRAGGHYRCVFREFPLGNLYKADFVVVNSYSGVWEVKFVELEPVDVRILTKAGTPARRLQGAIKQVRDWRDYFGRHKEAVREDLVRWAKAHDILGYSSDKHVISNMSGNYLHDPATYLTASYHIAIGRRAALSPEEHQAKSRLHSDIEILTYDRFQDLVNTWCRVPPRTAPGSESNGIR